MKLIIKNNRKKYKFIIKEKIKEIYIIYGYKEELFLYLEIKYSQVKFVFSRTIFDNIFRITM
ncbi:hypothetical protein C7Y58_00885 [Fusobacterium nucleatum subsp. nucleatum ATCC 25586]|uniref:Uncharacterized protein n=2 Tax=Fusobacterium nucleatum subsp. nucleatum TaxID=76856 RepID=Q8RIC8_FUSNN|nr:unknown [Fusobacterium nucleatum subsp. nucleatum ATCC 25586]ALF23115.1 hypothetical protein RO05_01380 [Fusobacterium nucleatum subsp. nucleatum ChDC F316]ASG25555.1 hypothetical protein RN84_00595 [Fusobacterium nucleatum subsp. nucleatum]AVQ14210.1 hypothetical protein C7Y58_00885 [Fusobacterium nucleatum subsp. nucleatum ATCC 25586]KUL99572.1 hypothetical protein RO03_08700 [Fusobacterium nucleatum subsp. nucleatum]